LLKVAKNQTKPLITLWQKPNFLVDTSKK
jgi:hypothetical protein